MRKPWALTDRLYYIALPIAGIAAIMGFFQSFAGWRLAVDLLGLAFAGGLYVVPSFASVQAGAAAALHFFDLRLTDTILQQEQQ